MKDSISLAILLFGLLGAVCVTGSYVREIRDDVRAIRSETQGLPAAECPASSPEKVVTL